MDPIIGAAAIGAGSSLIGGLLGSKSESKAVKKNIRWQREAAQNSIQWRVNDAKAAGLAPLAALGAQTFNASPVAVGGNALGEGVANAGSKISAAIMQNEVMQENRANGAQTRATQRAQERMYNSQAYLNNVSAFGETMTGVNAMFPQRQRATKQALMDKYIKINNPFTGKTEWIPNPQIYELPELLGAAMYGRAGWEDTAQRPAPPDRYGSVGDSPKRYDRGTREGFRFNGM